MTITSEQLRKMALKIEDDWPPISSSGLRAAADCIDELTLERDALRKLIERVCPEPHLTLNTDWRAEARRLGCKL